MNIAAGVYVSRVPDKTTSGLGKLNFWLATQNPKFQSVEIGVLFENFRGTTLLGLSAQNIQHGFSGFRLSEFQTKMD